MENFTYATVKGSSVDMYFRRQVKTFLCKTYFTAIQAAMQIVH